CREALQTAQAARSESAPQLAPLFADLDLYVAVPLALLSGDDLLRPRPAAPELANYLKLATEAGGIGTVALFGEPREVDFSLFRPRGHYAKDPWLQWYFRALSWLEHVDLRLVDYDAIGRPTLHLPALAAAMLLREALTQSGERAAWDDLDRLFSA